MVVVSSAVRAGARARGGTERYWEEGESSLESSAPCATREHKGTSCLTERCPSSSSRGPSGVCVEAMDAMRLLFELLARRREA